MAAVDHPPAPRRTYGRARAAPIEEDDGPSLLVSAPSITEKPALAAPSPAKKLLSGFVDRSATWRSELLSSDMTGQKEEEEGEDEAELKKMMERLRRNARAGTSATIPLDAGEPLSGPVEPKVAAAPVPKQLAPPVLDSTRTLAAFSSSTLTELSTDPPSSQGTSVLRISPRPIIHQSLVASSSVIEETIPIRKPGSSRPSGHARRIIDSEDEEDQDASAPHAREAIRSRSATPTTGEIPDILPSPGIRFTPTPSPPGKKGAGKGKGPAGYLDRLAGESDGEDEEDARRGKAKSPSPSDASGEEKEVKAKKTKVKPLNKKDKLEMQKDMARAGRQRTVVPAKATAGHLPMSSYLPDATAVIKALHDDSLNPHTTPALMFAHSPHSSDIKLESSIVAFTSSAGPSNAPAEGITVNLASSPTPAGSRTGKPSRTSREGSADEEIPDLDIAFQAKPSKPAKPDLAAIKAAALKAAEAAKKPVRMSGSDSEDDFSVLPKGAMIPSRKPAPPPRDPLAKRMMPPKIERGAAPSPHRNLQVAGRPKKPRDATETYIEFAGKTWDHAGLRGANNGTRKAGQKAGRDVVIPQFAMDQTMKAAHAAQVKAIAAKKQAEWGRLKALPEKKVDVEKILERANEIREHEVKEEQGLWDEDDDDGDFNPDGEDDDVEDAEEEGEDGDDGIQYSGEEDAGEGVEEEDAESIAATEKDASDEDKENRTAMAAGEDEEDGSMVQLPRATKGKRRVNRIAGSDSEDDETPRRSTSTRAPLAEMAVPQPVSAVNEAPMLGFDLAGFGDGAEGGFSQLFEATQLNSMPSEQDAFAGLRGGHQGLLPSQALLPGVNISDTQKERDNALVAGDMDDDDPSMLMPAKKQQYLNSQGFFTQTKPIRSEPTQIGEDTPQPRKNGLQSDWSFGFDEIPAAAEEDSSSPSAQSSRQIVPSPTQQSPMLSRLKRRASSDVDLDPVEEEDEDEDEAGEARGDDEDGSSPTKPQKNAFNKMMKAAKRAEEREKRKMERGNWLEEQAEESDEDNGWGREGGSDDEGEDGEDGPDEYLKDLVSDEQISEEERLRQDELAKEKMMEISKADDEKREAQARDVVDGKHRTKRRGMDFYSDDEDEDGKPRRLSKKQKRKRDLGKEDGLDKLEGEENVFRRVYEEDLESDGEDDTLDDPLPVSPKHQPLTRERDSPSPKKRLSMKEKLDMLKRRALLNREVDEEEEQRRLDDEAGFTDGYLNDPIELDEDGDVMMMEESQFSISRTSRTAVMTTTTTGLSKTTSVRSVESYQAYVQTESQTTRRVGAIAGGGSVVVNKSIPALNPGARRGMPPPSRSNSTNSSSSGGVLMSKTNRFH